MSTTITGNVIPVSEEYGQETVASLAEAQQQVGAVVEPPSGWSLGGVTVSTLRLGFAAPNNPLAQSGVSNDAGHASIPVVAEAQTQSARLQFSHGTETLDVQILPMGDPLVAIWAENLLSRGPRKSVGFGHGFTAGDTTLLVADDQLIRATYGDRSEAALAAAGTPAWHSQVGARAAELTAQLRRG